MSEFTSVTRRRFLQISATAAGGLLIGFHLPRFARYAEAATAEETAINAWLRIAPDDSVTILVANSEMGQGVYTALPMLIAEELEVDWRKVKGEMAPADPTYRNLNFGVQATGGSTSVRWAFDPLRKVGATAREMLRQAAAAKWKVPRAECVARNGRIVHHPTGRALGYGTLAVAATKVEPPAEVQLKKRDEWKLLGKPTRRLDTPAKVNGAAQFGIDVQVNGMRVATVMACPVFGGKLKRVDDTPALAVRGVRAVVPLEDAVIVVANGYWPAKKGLDALRPVWDEGSRAGVSSATIREQLKAALGKEGAVAHSEGDIAAAKASATQRVEAVYEVPFLAHATMEPMNATAHVKADGVEIWAPTQGQWPIQQVVSGMLEMKPEQIKVHTTFLGGGFGRKFEFDFVVQAVQASKAVGAPVKLVWSREEDVRHDFYRPAAMARFDAGLDADGMPMAWEARLACPSIMTRVFPDWVKEGVDPSSVEGASGIPYGIANQRVEYVMTDTGVPVGFWRSVGSSQNAFFVQSFLDELAHAAGKDPLDYRLRLLGSKPRYRKVLETAAKAAGWGTPAPAGRFRGLALHDSFGSIVGEVAEISIDDGGAITVHKVTCAVDCGWTVNPDTVVAQMESGIVYGLTAALFGEVTLEKGRVQQGNFDTYKMLHLSQMPEIDVHIIESGTELGGIGEPGTPPIAPAVANAVFAATGKRVRKLPIRPEDLRAA